MHHMLRRMVLIAAVLAVVLAYAPSAMAYLGAQKLLIEELSAAPAIDAVAESIWENVPSLNMSDKYSLSPPQFFPVGGVADHSGTFKAGWYGSSIFFFFTISDDDEDHSAIDVGMAHVDGLEIIIDLGNLQQSVAQGQNQANAYDAYGGPTQFFANLNEAGMAVNGTIPMTPAQADYAYDVTSVAGTHFIEVELKMSSAAIAAAGASTLADITSFGLVLGYNDADTIGQTTAGTEGTSGRDAVIFWWGGEQLAPGEYNLVSEGYLPYWEGSTTFGILGEASFVGAGQGGSGDTVDDGSCDYEIEFFESVGQGTADYVAAFLPELGLPAQYSDWDLDGDGIPELWQLALLVEVLCNDAHPLHASVLADNETIMGVVPDQFLAANLGLNEAMRAVTIELWGLVGEGYALEDLLALPIFGAAGKTAGEPFSGAGDLDSDGLTNYEEYVAVLATGGGMDAFVAAASSASPFWPGNPELPVGSLLGLGLLACAAAVGGVLALKREE